MNKVILIGRLARDPEMRTTATGTNVTRFTVAVSRPFTGAGGDRGADFISCIAWRRQAENIAKYCTKGSQIAVEGRIQTGSYDGQDGSKRYVTEVIADNVEFMSSSRNNPNSGQTPVSAYVDTTSSVYMDEPSPEIGVDVSTEDPFKNFGSEVSLSDDDLPF